jgi:hypothetical protein
MMPEGVADAGRELSSNEEKGRRDGNPVRKGWDALHERTELPSGLPRPVEE